MNQEALKISQTYQKLMIDFLKNKGASTTFGEMFAEAEKHHCDSLAAVLVSLKKKNVISYKKIILMYPQDINETVTLLKDDFDPFI